MSVDLPTGVYNIDYYSGGSRERGCDREVGVSYVRRMVAALAPGDGLVAHCMSERGRSFSFGSCAGPRDFWNPDLGGWDIR